MIETTESFYILCKNFHEKSFALVEVIFFRLKFGKNLSIKKHCLSPNVHFKSRKVNFIAWQSSKLGQSEPDPPGHPV
jgi:hypothetical protein